MHSLQYRYVVLSWHLWCLKHIVLLKSMPLVALDILTTNIRLEEMLIFLYRIELLCFFGVLGLLLGSH